ncbi:MAG: PLP-dependent aspartate aminotransferase family protein [Phycisphaerales bacterium]
MSAFRFDTLAVHAGCPDDPLTGAVTTPIYQTTTFAQRELPEHRKPEWCYSRTGNPTRAALEEALGALESPAGPPARALAFASGLAAANALLQTLSVGDHVVASQDLYGGCFRLFTKVFARFGVVFSLVDTTDPHHVAAALTRSTRLVWLETPSNPLLRITDIRRCCEIARTHGAASVVDNTFATPVFQRPLELGADIVLHSTTKYLGGHCDVLGGALITSNPEWHERLRFIQNATGATPGPQDCFLLLRGLKTLRLRVEQHARNAAAIAHRLEQHPEVVRVAYPGLRRHPQHELARRQSSGFGSILSLELKGGIERVRALVPRLRLWPLAESLGGVKSLWCHPATMTHASVDAAERARVGIGDGLIRLSVGLEDAEDLVADLEQALEATRDRGAAGEAHGVASLHASSVEVRP